MKLAKLLIDEMNLILICLLLIGLICCLIRKVGMHTPTSEYFARLEAQYARDYQLALTVECSRCSAHPGDGCYWTTGDAKDLEFHLERLLSAKSAAKPI